MPAKLGETNDADMAVDGAHLDDVQTSATQLLKNVYVDTTYELLADWERVLGIATSAGTSRAARMAACANKFKEKGGLSIPHFIELAASLGHEITIHEGPRPFMIGIGEIGVTQLYPPEVIFCWRVDFASPVSEIKYKFRIGVSAIGDRLMSFGVSSLQEIIQDLKPAHTFVSFYYPHIINERFEGDGTEEFWSHSIGTGSSLDPDNIEITPPDGTENLKATSGSPSFTALGIRDYGTEQATTYTRIGLYVAAEDLLVGELKELASAKDSTSTAVWRLYLGRDAGNNLGFRFSIYNAGSWHNYDFGVISLSQWYSISIQYSAADLAWSWRLDDDEKNSGNLTGVYKTGIQTWRLGFSDAASQKSLAVHYSSLRVSTDIWPE